MDCPRDLVSALECPSVLHRRHVGHFRLSLPEVTPLGAGIFLVVFRPNPAFWSNATHVRATV